MHQLKQLAEIIPAGKTRISAADFLGYVARSTSPDRAGGKNRFSRDVVKSLPRETRDKINEEAGIVPLEHEEQVELVQWLILKGIRFNTTPNGGYRHKKTAAELRAEGSTPGFCDLTVWPEPGSGLPVVFVEMKRTKGGRVSEDQQGWIDYFHTMQELGYPFRAYVAKGFRQAREILESEGYGLDPVDYRPGLQKSVKGQPNP